MTHVAPYFYTWGIGNPAYKVKDLMDAKEKLGLKAVTLAFLTGAPGYVSNTHFGELPISQIQEFIRDGGKVILSVGGANGPFIEQMIPNEEELFQKFDQILTLTGIRSLDFDVEGAYLGDTQCNQRRLTLIQHLKAKYAGLSVSYTLPVMPYRSEWDPGGLPQLGIDLMNLTTQTGVDIDLINLMTMDFGFTVPGKSYGQTCISALDQTVKQLRGIYPEKSEQELYSMMGMTPMIGQNDVAAEVFTLSDAHEVIAYAKQKNLALLSFWALQRDQVGQGDLAICSKVNQKDFEFYQAFKEVQSDVSIPTPVPPTPEPGPVLPNPEPKPKPDRIEQIVRKALLASVPKITKKIKDYLNQSH